MKLSASVPAMARCGSSPVLATEGNKYGSEHVESGHKYGNHSSVEQYRIIGERRCQDFIFAPEAGKRPDTGNTQRSDKKGSISPWHCLAQATHLPHIEGSRAMADTAGTKKQECFEESMIEQVKDAYGNTANTQTQHHIAELADSRISQDTLDVGHHQAHAGSKNSCKTTDDSHRS